MDCNPAHFSLKMDFHKADEDSWLLPDRLFLFFFSLIFLTHFFYFHLVLLRFAPSPFSRERDSAKMFVNVYIKFWEGLMDIPLGEQDAPSSTWALWPPSPDPFHSLY